MASIEAKIQLALNALKEGQIQHIREAARLYKAPETTLRRRRKGGKSRQDTPPPRQKLTKLEEKAIIQNMLELDSQSFPPRLASVEDMANQLLDARGASCIGVN